MSRVEEIKAAIERLTLEERCELEALLRQQPDDAWDAQMKQDAAAGRFEAINRAAAESDVAGETKALPDILGDA